MGIKKAHALTYSVNNLDLAQLASFATVLLKQKREKKITNRVRPVIDLDASWIVRSTRSSYNSRVSYLFRLARTLKNVGFDVFIVLDGEDRHESKRASISRRANLYEKKNNMKNVKTKLIDIISRIQSSNDDGLTPYLINEKQKLSEKLQSMEESITKDSCDVGDKIYNSLKK